MTVWVLDVLVLSVRVGVAEVDEHAYTIVLDGIFFDGECEMYGGRVHVDEGDIIRDHLSLMLEVAIVDGIQTFAGDHMLVESALQSIVINKGFDRIDDIATELESDDILLRRHDQLF